MGNFANKYNKSTGFTKKADKETPYVSLKDIVKTDGLKGIYKLNALYINRKNRFGDSPVAFIDGMLVNLPMHLTPTVEEMLKDSDLIDCINNGKFGFTTYEYESEGKQHYSINWIDLN